MEKNPTSNPKEVHLRLKHSSLLTGKSSRMMWHNLAWQLRRQNRHNVRVFFRFRTTAMPQPQKTLTRIWQLGHMKTTFPLHVPRHQEPSTTTIGRRCKSRNVSNVLVVWMYNLDHERRGASQQVTKKDVKQSPQKHSTIYQRQITLTIIIAMTPQTTKKRKSMMQRSVAI